MKKSSFLLDSTYLYGLSSYAWLGKVDYVCVGILVDKFLIQYGSMYTYMYMCVIEMGILEENKQLDVV